jgi:hypothetical protein
VLSKTLTVSGPVYTSAQALADWTAAAQPAPAVPAATLIAQPSYLWNDGRGTGSGDAFGVWRYPF